MVVNANGKTQFADKQINKAPTLAQALAPTTYKTK